MKIPFKIFLVIVLVLCGLSKKITFGFGEIDDAFKPHLEQWVKDAKKYHGPEYKLPHISVVFGGESDVKLLGPSVIGVCIPIPGNPVVKIHRDFWRFSSYTTREQLLFHELGHCILNRWHNDDTIFGDPVTIMHSYLNAAEYAYRKRREYYIKELFTN